MKKIWFLFIMSLFIVSSCATVYRTGYDNVAYDTPEKALSARLIKQKEILEQITPTDTPINGSVVFILPSETLILQKYIATHVKGEPSQDQIKQRSYLVSIIKNELSFFANGLTKRKLFSDVKIIESEKLEDADFSEDYAVYAIHGQWFLKKKEGTPIPIQVNHKLPTPKEQLMDWFGNIEKAAK